MSWRTHAQELVVEEYRQRSDRLAADLHATVQGNRATDPLLEVSDLELHVSPSVRHQLLLMVGPAVDWSAETGTLRYRGIRVVTVPQLQGWVLHRVLPRFAPRVPHPED